MRLRSAAFVFRALTVGRLLQSLSRETPFFSFFPSLVNKVGSGRLSSNREESCETSVGTNRLAIPFPLEGAVDRVPLIGPLTGRARIDVDTEPGRWPQSVINLSREHASSSSSSRLCGFVSPLAISLRSPARDTIIAQVSHPAGKFLSPCRDQCL